MGFYCGFLLDQKRKGKNIFNGDFPVNFLIILEELKHTRLYLYFTLDNLF